MDNFIKAVLEEEDLQSVVALHCIEDFEHSGARGGNALITGAAAALAMGNGGEIIPTEEIIQRHNEAYPGLRIPLNNVTRNIPSGVMKYIADTMYQHGWQFNEFMGNFGNYVIMYSSIAGGSAVVAGFSGLALLCAFLAMLVVTQGIQYNTVTGWRGNVIERRVATTANWANPDPQPDRNLIENCRENDNHMQTRAEYIIRQTHWFGPDDVTGSSGYMPYAGANALLSRVDIEDKPIMILHGLAGSVNSHEEQADQPFLVFRGNQPQPVEKDTNNYIRCRAIKASDGFRCVNCLHIKNTSGFCGQHKNWPINGGQVADDTWAVDILSESNQTRAPSRVVESCKNILKF